MPLGRPGSGLVELASGIDALYCSGRVELPGAFLRELECAREAAEMSGLDMPVPVGGVEFHVPDQGLGRYRFRLSHPNGVVGVSPSAVLPALRIQPRATFLHGVGARAAIGWFRSVLEAGCGDPIAFTTSRLDLHADWQGWELRGEDRCNFVCRSESRTTHEQGDLLTGFQFGERRTKTVSARIYDKTAEIRKKGTAYWEDIWGDRYDRSRPVIRVEFELGRQGLAEFGIRSPEEAIDASGGLWAYLADKWLSLRTPTDDGTRSRWPVAPEWERIRRASLADVGYGLERVYAGRQRGLTEKLLPNLCGYLVSFAAVSGLFCIEETCARLVEAVPGSCLSRGASFVSRVDARRAELGLR